MLKTHLAQEAELTPELRTLFKRASYRSQKRIQDKLRVTPVDWAGARELPYLRKEPLLLFL
jgi:hypothetical protein